MGWLVPVLLHGHRPSVPQFSHLGSEAFGSARPEQSNRCFDMGMAPEQPGAPGFP